MVVINISLLCLVSLKKMKKAGTPSLIMFTLIIPLQALLFSLYTAFLNKQEPLFCQAQLLDKYYTRQYINFSPYFPLTCLFNSFQTLRIFSAFIFCIVPRQIFLGKKRRQCVVFNHVWSTHCPVSLLHLGSINCLVSRRFRLIVRVQIK